MAIDSLGSYRKYFRNMVSNISGMVYHIAKNLLPDSLTSLSIVHSVSFKKSVFLKDTLFVLKGQRFLQLIYRDDYPKAISNSGTSHSSGKSVTGV